MNDKEKSYWLADKIPAYGDYAKEAALVLQKQADELESLRTELASLKEQNAMLTVQEPEGWKLVPEDETAEMIAASHKVDMSNDDTVGFIHNVWHTMLAASPTLDKESK